MHFQSCRRKERNDKVAGNGTLVEMFLSSVEIDIELASVTQAKWLEGLGMGFPYHEYSSWVTEQKIDLRQWPHIELTWNTLSSNQSEPSPVSTILAFNIKPNNVVYHFFLKNCYYVLSAKMFSKLWMLEKMLVHNITLSLHIPPLSFSFSLFLFLSQQIIKSCHKNKTEIIK